MIDRVVGITAPSPVTACSPIWVDGSVTSIARHRRRTEGHQPGQQDALAPEPVAERAMGSDKGDASEEAMSCPSTPHARSLCSCRGTKDSGR